MAIDLMVQAGASYIGPWVDVRAVGKKLYSMRVTVGNQTGVPNADAGNIFIEHQPTLNGPIIQLAQVAAAQMPVDVIIDHPVDQIRARTDAGIAGGTASAWLTPHA